MGLRSVLQTAARTAVTAVGDIAVDVEYLSVIEQELDPTVGVEPYFDTYEGINGVLAEYDERQIDGVNILPRDQQFLLPGIGLAFTPKAGDRVRVTAGEDLQLWDVVNPKVDPAGALWILQMRRVQ